MAFLLKEGSLNNNKKPNNNVQRQQQRPRSREDEIYADLMAESEPKPQDQGIISNLTTGVTRGAKSGLGGILGGLGYASQAETGVGGDFANVMNKLAEENARRKQYGWTDMIPFANDYYTSPEGASYDVGQVVGSMAVPMALGAGTAATLGTGGAALPVVGAGLGGLVMAASEGGNTYKDALEQGYSEEEARSAGRTDAAIKAPFYMLSEGLTGAAGKALLSRAGKEAVKEGLGRTILKKGGTLLGEGLNEGLEEVFENKSSNYALNRDPNKSLVGDVIGGTANPYTWNDEDQEAFRSAFMGSLLTGGIGAGAAKAYHTAVGDNTETKAKPKSAPEKVETPAQADDVLDTAEKIDERLEEIDGKIEAAAVSGNTREIARLGRERQELIEARENVLPEDLESLEKLQSKVDDEIEKVSNDIESAVVDLGEAKNKRKAAEKLQSLYEQRGKLAERSEQIANKIEMARASKPTPQRTNTPQPTPGVNYGENLGERMQVAEATDVGRAQRVDPQDVANGIGRAQGADYGALMGEDVAPTQPWQGYNTNPKPQPTPKPTGPSYAEQQRQQAEQQRLQAEQAQRDTGWYQMETEYAQRKAMEAAKQKGFSENIGEWKAATMKPGESATVQDYVNSTGETLRIAKNDKNGLMKVSKGNEETYFTSLADAEEFVKSGKSPYDKLNARERAEKATEIRAAMAGKDAVNRALDRLKEKFTKAKTEQEVNQITGEAISDPNRILKESDIGKAMVEAKKRIKEELRVKGAKQAREKGFAAKLGDWYAVYDENASENEQEYVNEKGAKIQIAIDESGPVSVIKSKGGSYWFTNLADANEFVETGKNPYDKLTKEERIEKEVEIRAALAGKEAVEKALSDLKDKYDKAKTTADVANITAEAYRDPNRILKLSQIGNLQREAKNKIRRREEEERRRREEQERRRKEEQEAIIKDFESKIDGFINDFLNSVKQGESVVDINKKLKSYKGKAVALHTKIKKDGKLTEAQVSDIRAKYMNKFAKAKEDALIKARSTKPSPSTNDGRKYYEYDEYKKKFGFAYGFLVERKSNDVDFKNLISLGYRILDANGESGNVLSIQGTGFFVGYNKKTDGKSRAKQGRGYWMVGGVEKNIQEANDWISDKSKSLLDLQAYKATNYVFNNQGILINNKGEVLSCDSGQFLNLLIKKYGDDLIFFNPDVRPNSKFPELIIALKDKSGKYNAIGKLSTSQPYSGFKISEAIKENAFVGRKGTDFRNGKDVSIDEVKNKFALFDIDIQVKEREQELLNKFYDSFSDLAELLQVDPKALSFGGRLKIRIVSSHGGNLGSLLPAMNMFFEPRITLIENEFEDGPSLAHEWLHGLDNWFGVRYSDYEHMISKSDAVMRIARGLATNFRSGVRPEVLKAWGNVWKTLKEVGFENRSEKLDNGRVQKYWSTQWEMLARSFEAYIGEKLLQQGKSSSYLASSQRSADRNYLQSDEERAKVYAAFDDFLNTLKVHNEDIRGRSVPVFYSASEQRKIVRSFADVVEEVVKANPGASFSLNPDGEIIMEQKDGTRTKVNIVDNILLNDSQMQDAKESHGLKGNIIINGMWQKATEAGFNSVLTLSRRSERGTAFHEALHAAIDNALTAKEKDALYSYYSKKAKELGMDVEEVIADAYRDWVLARQDNKGSIFGKLWRKVKDFCSRMVSAFSKSAEVNRIFQDIESGKVRERGNRNENINKAKTDKNQNSKSEQDQVGKQNALKGEEEKVREVSYSARVEETPKIRKELTVSSDYDYGHKEKQFDIIQANNPMNDEYHTGIRSVNDIMSFEQAYERALNDSDGLFDEYPDWTEKMARDIMNTPGDKVKKVTIYSSKPIQPGAFVTPSRRMAEDYAGGGKIYSKTVSVDRVAWINSNEGQFAWAKESKVHYDNLSSVQKKAVDKYLSEGGDNDRLGRLLKSPSYRETPWARQAYNAILWKMAARELMAGREPNFYSALSDPTVKKAHDKLLEGGTKGAWDYVIGTKDGFIGHADKPVNAINASYTNCNPSLDCAKFCYAATGRNYSVNMNKQEMVNFLIEEYPIESARRVAEQYKLTPQYRDKINQEALRILDKGDISEKWLPFIKEVNKQGIRLQIFSKRAELLSKIDANKNLVMLSIDSSNAGLADKYKDLPLAFVWSGPQDNARLEKERARFERLGGVILPVRIGKEVLSQDIVDKLPLWSKPYQCPIDSGVKKIGEHNCTKCDKNGGMGCFFGRVTSEVMKKLAVMEDLSNDAVSDMIKKKIDELSELYALKGQYIDERQRQQLFKYLDTLYAGGMGRYDDGRNSRENRGNEEVSSGSRETKEEERRGSRKVLPRTSGEKVVTVDSGDVKYSARSVDDDLQAVREKYEGTKEWMKAPNGKKTKLTERQWLQVRTPKFKAWFGDWENNPEKSSKVLDENGEPLAVYHGTPTAEFEQFSEGITYTTADQEVAQYYSEHNGDIVSRKDSYIDLNIDKKPLKDVLKFIEKHGGEKYQEYNPDVVDLVKNAFGKTEDDLADFFGDETDNSMKNREEWLDEHSEDTFEGWQQDLYDAVEEYHELAQKAVDGDISKSEAERMVEFESQVKEIRKEQKTLAKRFLRGAEIGDILKKNPVLRSDEKMYVSQENDSVPFSESELREQAGELARQKSAKGLFPLFANIKNPFIYESKGKDWKRLSLVEYTNDEADDDVTTDDIAKWARKQGYDGVIFKNVFDSDAHSADEFVTFKPNQLKSSTENNGNFSEDNDNIYYSARSVDDNESPEARGARAVSRTEKETVVERLRNAVKSAYTDWVDKLEPLNKLQAEIENALGYKLDYDQNVYKQARMAESTARGRAEMLVMGVDPEATVEAINKTLKNKKLQYNVTLRSVFDLIKDADMSEKHPDYLDNGGFENWQHAFSTYLTARRQVELQNQNSDYVGPMDEQDARDIVKNAPKELAEAAKKYYQYNDNMLTIAEDAGLISEEVHEALNDKYSDYAPMMRDFSDTAGVESFFGGLGGRGIGNVSSFLKKISKDGSSRNVIDPLEITVKNTYMVLDRAERNKVAQLFVDLSHENGIGEFIEPVDRDTSDPKNSIFTVMVDGKKQAFKTMPEFYGAIAGYNQQGAGAIGSLVRTAAQCLRTGATISPDFMFRNLIRDTIFAGISSKTGFRPLIDTIRGMQALRHNKELAEEFKAAGVPMSNFVGTNRRGAMETLNKLTGGDKQYHKLDPRRIISALYEMAQDYSELAEEGTRMGEFMRAREQGLSIEEAGFLAKEITLDFSRSGVYGQKYNQAVPFFNACIQGGDKFVRLMKHEPRATFMGVAKYIILPSLALWCMNHDEDWYKDLPEDVKNGSWCIKTGDTIWRIPKPQEAGVLFGSGMERFLDMVNGEDPKAMKNWAREYFFGTCMPNFIPTLVLPILEWVTNYSFFTGKEVVGTKYKRLPNEQQYSLYTTELAKRVGSVTGTSPMKIDNTIKGYFGTAGSFVATSMDNIFGKEYESPEKRWSEYAGIRGITYQEGRRSQAVSDFYELVDEANKQHEGYGKKGKPAGYVVGLRQANKKISDLNKDIRNTTIARNLTPEQKRAKIDKIQIQIRNIARLAIARFKDKVNR